MKTRLSMIGLALLAIMNVKCAISDFVLQNTAPPASPSPLATTIKAGDGYITDASTLCEELQQITRIPYESDTHTGDPVYDGLMLKGNEVLPCLVARITDVTEIPDPREAPHVHGFTVGDAAVFMIHRISKTPIEKILPKAYAKMWQDEGIYTYFEYVEKLENRRKIQLWWKNRLKLD